MVIVFKVKTLLDLVCRAAPEMYRLFVQVLRAIGTAEETDAVNHVYRRLNAVNFSKGLLETFAADSTSRLMVLAVRGVRWSDWGLGAPHNEHAAKTVILNMQTKQFEIRR